MNNQGANCSQVHFALQGEECGWALIPGRRASRLPWAILFHAFSVKICVIASGTDWLKHDGRDALTGAKCWLTAYDS